MGAKHSTPIPTDEDLSFVHPTPSTLLHPQVPADKFYHLVMKEKIWTSWSADSFGVKYLKGNDANAPPTEGDRFEVDVKGKSFTFRDTMVLRDNANETPVAVMYAMFLKWETTFKIYTFTPNLENQVLSKQKYDGRDLYEWAECKDKFFSVRKDMKTVDGTTYVMDGVGKIFAGKRKMRVTRDGKPCMLAEEQTLGIFTGNQWVLKIGPGIDPCLMVAFMAIMDEMNENKDSK